ncbi:MAG: hypothetical protein AABY22_20670, partial [Nanoarchaeota archaeon]
YKHDPGCGSKDCHGDCGHCEIEILCGVLANSFNEAEKKVKNFKLKDREGQTYYPYAISWDGNFPEYEEVELIE